MTLLTDLEDQIAIADVNLERLDSAVNDAPGTFTTKDGTVVTNLRQRLQDAAFTVPVAFAAGLEPADGSFTVVHDGGLYGANPASIPFTTTSTFNPAQWYLLNTIDYGTVAAMVAASAPSRGVGSEWRAGGFKFIELDPSDTDPDHTNGAGVKLEYDPEHGDYIPYALFTTNHPTQGPSFPNDQGAVLERAMRKAAAKSGSIDWGNYWYRPRRTIHIKDQASGDQVKVMKGAGCKFIFDAAGSYDKFRLDDGSADITHDDTRVAFDVGGTTFSWQGDFEIVGVYLNKMQAVDRESIQQNLSAFGCLFESGTEMVASGQVRVEGFAHWRYVPEKATGFGSRQMARTTGQFRVNFCLSEFGVYSTATNGSDDSNMDIHVARCGHHGSVNESLITGTELNFRSIFVTGLTDKTANDDWEDSTFSISDGVVGATLSAPHDHLAPGHYITVLDAFEIDGAGTSIPWVMRVASVSGTSVTFDAKTVPNLPNAGSKTGLRWFYRPPLVTINNGHLGASMSMYWEGYRHGIVINETSLFSGAYDTKGGGTRLSGLGGTLVQVLGDDSSVKIEAHEALLETTGLRGIVGFGMIYETATGAENKARMDIGIKRDRSGANQDLIKPVIGFDPPEYHLSGSRTADATREFRDLNIEVRYTDRTDQLYIQSGGVANWVSYRDGNGIFFNYGAKGNGTPNVSYSVGTTNVEIFTGAQIGLNTTWVVKGANSARNTAGAMAYIGVDGSGNITVWGQMGTNLTYEATGTSLFARRGSGTSSCIFSLSPGP